MRTCNRCKNKKELSEYQSDKTSKGGLSTVCKSCKSENAKKLYQINRIARLKQIAEYRRKNPEKSLEQSRKYYLTHKDEIVVKRQIKRLENPTFERKYWLKSKYGITPNTYDDMYSKQDGKCAICEIHSSKLTKPLFVDHSHSTKKVRSLLCTNCNAGIGSLKEDVNLLKKAIKYLIKHN